jgi:hypothetical protein
LLYVDELAKMWRAAERRRGYSPIGERICVPVRHGGRKNAAALVGALSIEGIQVATPVDTKINGNIGKSFCDDIRLLCKVVGYDV